MSKFKLNKTLKGYPAYKTSLLTIKLLALFVSIFTISCNESKYHVDIYQTSKNGDNLKFSSKDIDNQSQIDANQIQLNINPNIEFQKFIGFGASFTESSAWNLATIPVAKRLEVLEKLFSPTKGAGFTLTRTHINSCDYSNNHYVYIDEKQIK
ncbi:MAG: hypothetical protein HKN51_17680 [Saprospiraceae bacterium]|nr:hypothetical protein [Saprospiraceae bacterium]